MENTAKIEMVHTIQRHVGEDSPPLLHLTNSSNPMIPTTAEIIKSPRRRKIMAVCSQKISYPSTPLQTDSLPTAGSALISLQGLSPAFPIVVRNVSVRSEPRAPEKV